MYIDYYLKFESEQDYLNTLSSRISDETGQTEYFYPIEADVDAGITIFKEVEEQVYDDESKTMVNRVIRVPGYHVNVRTREGITLPDTWLSALVNPQPITPYRTFAGPAKTYVATSTSDTLKESEDARI